MAYIQKDRVKETTTTTGTGAVTLAGAVAGFQAFSAVMSVADTCYYVIVSATGTDWETGTGTYSSASVLTRTTVLSSSNSGNAVSFASGTKDVFMGPIANQVNDIAHGGTGATTAADARTNLGAGTVTSVAGTGTVSGLTLTGTVTAAGSLTLGGTLSAISLTTGVSGTLPIANGGTNAITAAAARTSLGLVIGTDVQAYDTDLTTWAGVTPATGVATFLATPSSANLAAALTDETGTGAAVFATSPTLVTPLSNTLSSIPVTSTSAGNALAVSAGNALTTGVGGNLTLKAGTGAGSAGAGGNVILQPGAQGSSGGAGKVYIQTASGFGTTAFYNDGTNATYMFMTGNLATSGTIEGTTVTAYTAIRVGSNLRFADNSNQRAVSLDSVSHIAWTNAVNNTSATIDCGIKRAALGTLHITGLNTTDGGSFSFPSNTTAGSPVTIAANTDNLACSPSAFQRINCTSASNLTGIAPPTGGTHVDGRMIRVYNVGAATLTLKHNVTSTATNLFFNTTGADIALATNAYAELIYDITDNGRGGAGWRVR